MLQSAFAIYFREQDGGAGGLPPMIITTHTHSVKSFSEPTLLMLLHWIFALWLNSGFIVTDDGFLGLDTVAYMRQREMATDIIAFDVIKTIAPTFNPI